MSHYNKILKSTKQKNILRDGQTARSNEAKGRLPSFSYSECPQPIQEGWYMNSVLKKRIFGVATEWNIENLVKFSLPAR